MSRALRVLLGSVLCLCQWKMVPMIRLELILEGF